MGNGGLWKRVAAGIITAIVVSVLMGLYGHDRRIAANEIRIESTEEKQQDQYQQIDKRLTRMDDKLDRLIERR